MKIGRFILGGFLSLLMALSLSCSSTPQPIAGREDFIGFITGIRPDGGSDVLGQTFAESHADKIVTRYIVTITSETLIFRQQDDDDLRKVSFETFEHKQWVSVWFEGPTTGSFPVEGTAAQVVIE